MDLPAAERSNARQCAHAKIGAFACFGLAGVLLIASLLLPPPTQKARDAGLAASTFLPAR